MFFTPSSLVRRHQLHSYKRENVKKKMVKYAVALAYSGGQAGVA